MLRFPQLAETMTVVAQEGADAFYTGKIGQDLVKDVKEAGRDNRPVLGWLAEKTISGLCFLSEFRWNVGDGGFEELPSERRRRMETLAWEYSHAHPSSTYWGRPASLHSSINERFLEIVCFWLATAVKCLSTKLFFFADFPITAPMDIRQKTQMYHHFIEAAKFANGQRRSVCDPRFNPKKVWLLFALTQKTEEGKQVDASFFFSPAGALGKRRSRRPDSADSCCIQGPRSRLEQHVASYCR